MIGSQEKIEMFEVLLKWEVDEIQCREEGSLFHIRGAFIEKVLEWNLDQVELCTVLSICISAVSVLLFLI